MNSPETPLVDVDVDRAAELARLFDRLAEATADALEVAAVPGLSDAVLVASARAVEELGRRVDALRAAVAGEVVDRSPKGLGSERLSARMGCRTPIELIARVTGVAETTAARRASLGAAVASRSTITGEMLPSKFPAVAVAVAAGELGEDAARVIVGMLRSVQHRAGLDDLHSAEADLVASARGGFTADQTRVQAAVWKTALDPDGVEPDAEEAMRTRGVAKLGSRNGLVRWRLDLLPEISGKFETCIAAVVSPKSSPVFLTDEQAAEQSAGDVRTFPQRQHDAFASLIDAASRSAQVASMGGAAPTVLVTVTQQDLIDDRGAGWIDGVEEPISMAAIRQFACAGGIQKMLTNDDGRIVSLWSPERCFTPQQRTAIAARDGGCVITGCRIPAGWCEVHHVEEWARGGPTHTDNGVSLCWFHHRSIDTATGWQVRMRDGVPQVRAPGWMNPRGEWSAAGTARLRRDRR